MNEIIEQVIAHANETQPNECCGLVIERNGVREYVRCTNVSGDPLNQFVIAPEEYAAVEDMGEIVMVAHSHCFIPPRPSEPLPPAIARSAGSPALPSRTRGTPGWVRGSAS